MLYSQITEGLEEAEVDQFDVPLDESKDVRVIFNGIVDDFFEAMIKITKTQDLIYGIHCPPGNMVTITFKDRDCMLDFHEAVRWNLNDFGMLSCYPVISDKVFVTFRNVHPLLTEDEFIKILTDRCCAPVNVTCKKLYGYYSSTRTAEFPIEEFRKRPLKSFIYTDKEKKREILVKYSGQVDTCRICSAWGHRQDICPKKPANTVGETTKQVTRFKKVSLRNAQISNSEKIKKKQTKTSSPNQIEHVSPGKSNKAVKPSSAKTNKTIHSKISKVSTSTPNKTKVAYNNVSMNLFDDAWHTIDQTDVVCDSPPHTPLTPLKRLNSTNDEQTHGRSSKTTKEDK